MLTVYTSNTPTQDAARRVSTLLDEHKNADVLLLLSGGSAFSVLEHVDTTLLSKRVTVSVLDERFTQDPAASNFTQLTHSVFWERATKQHAHAVDPRPDVEETLSDTARRFDIALKHWHITHRDGVIIATMGVGADGHTSGVLPSPHNPETFFKQFMNTRHCVMGYRVDPRVNAHTERITTTLSYLVRHVHHAVVYVTGEEKRGALISLTHEAGTLSATPARIMRDMRDVRVYTDVRM